MLRKTHIFLAFLLFFCTILCVQKAAASHIVGGEVTYKCLGGNRYEITVAIYRDCLDGIQGAIAQDNPGFITIFQSNGREYLFDSISSPTATGVIVPPNFKNDCVSNPPKTCLNKITFTRTYVLDNSFTGYKVVYQRCCRNASILNLINPDNYGATYSATIPQASTATCNNSAVFKNFPPQIICVNNPLVYDHGATDADGDSLSYEFCQAYSGGTNTDPKPKPQFFADALIYRSPYTFRNPISGSPKIQIDPKTGLMTGTPNIQGRYVVSVCCKEWREGVLINTVTREFQFVITNCSKAVIADIPQYSNDFNTYLVNCKDYTVFFENRSIGGTAYDWDFGVQGINTDVSKEFQPTYIYPDSGLYVVKLIVNKGTTCSDSISRFVKVYPKLTAKFEALTKICPGDTINFTNQTSSTYEINSFQWNFDDNTSIDTNQNTRHAFINGGLYNVGLIVTNDQGCQDTAFKKILVDPFKPFIGLDTTIVKGERINFKGIGGINYFWTPATYLSDPNNTNPVGNFTDTGTFVYSVVAKSDQTNCVGRDTIIVNVLGNGYLALPNVFTPNGDGKNDVFRPLLVGYQQLRFFRIYNRYGQLMFETSDIKGAWDGTFNGKLQQLGVYYWLLGVTDRFGKESISKGDVTLIR